MKQFVVIKEKYNEDGSTSFQEVVGYYNSNTLKKILILKKFGIKRDENCKYVVINMLL